MRAIAAPPTSLRVALGRWVQTVRGLWTFSLSTSSLPALPLTAKETGALAQLQESKSEASCSNGDGSRNYKKNGEVAKEEDCSSEEVSSCKLDDPISKMQCKSHLYLLSEMSSRWDSI